MTLLPKSLLKAWGSHMYPCTCYSAGWWVLYMCSGNWAAEPRASGKASCKRWLLNHASEGNIGALWTAEKVERRLDVTLFRPARHFQLLSLVFVSNLEIMNYIVDSFNLVQYLYRGFPGGSEGKASACSVRDPGLVPGLGRSPGEGNDDPLQYSCMENPIDGGAW